MIRFLILDEDAEVHSGLTQFFRLLDEAAVATARPHVERVGHLRLARSRERTLPEASEDGGGRR